MKTKTIYHLDQDCNIVRIEVITKSRKKKKAHVEMNVKSMIETININHHKQQDQCCSSRSQLPPTQCKTEQTQRTLHSFLKECAQNGIFLPDDLVKHISHTFSAQDHSLTKAPENLDADRKYRYNF